MALLFIYALITGVQTRAQRRRNLPDEPAADQGFCVRLRGGEMRRFLSSDPGEVCVSRVI